MKNNKLFIQALNLIKESFKNLDSLGPVAVANFFEPSEAEEREIIQRDSYETINRIMKYLKI